MPVTIRSVTREDVSALLAIEQSSPSAAHWKREHYETLLENGIILLAEQASQLRGFICAKAVAGEREIENIVVTGDFLRRGIATALLRELMQRAQTEAASAILLEVRESNLPARRLYEKHGFRDEGRRRMYYKDPLEDAILYARRFERML
jgi:ribosomal-protein-alanine acetyltransferase